MGLTKKFRTIGIISGVLLIGSSFYHAFIFYSEPGIQFSKDIMFFISCYFVTGVILVSPWSLIRSKALIILLGGTLILALICLCLAIYSAYIWSIIHGAGETAYILITLLIFVGASQLLVLWSYYTKYDTST